MRRTTKRTAERLEQLLLGLDCDVRVALTHYSPIEGTLMGERLEIFPFLGSSSMRTGSTRSMRPAPR